MESLVENDLKSLLKKEMKKLKSFLSKIYTAEEVMLKKLKSEFN